ncbi:NmrA family NAD(P)-binding protein [Herbidospora cretacea]|uniref:NmrA family NAD(P)-binding protein n=1 Tax=Herbidospora cretacea TaxID=28444 RepID=UPI000772E7DE|nr:NAD(P)H-binding protein [Herbidospora cretacea]
MSESPILVLGGTGKTGARVARQLTELGHRPRIASRSGATRFDWHDSSTWPAAVDGMKAVYVVDEQGADAATMLTDFIGTATTAGVERLVLLSARPFTKRSDEPGLFRVEDVVSGSGLSWTILRPTWFFQNFSEPNFLCTEIAEGELRVTTREGTEPFIDAEDIAAVAVAALTGEGHDEAVYEMSGPRLMTFGEVVAEISAASGREVRLTVLSHEEYARHLVGRGHSRELADYVIRLFDAIDDGATSYLSDGVEKVTGRKARDFSEYAASVDWTKVFPG